MDEIIAIAEKGGPAEKFELARSFYSGIDDIEKDTEQAIYWFKEAAKVGSVDAMLFLGNGFVTGEISRKERETWLKLAIDKGSVKGLNYLGELYYNGGEAPVTDLTRALYWFKRAGEAGNSWAQYSLFEMYHFGRLVKKNKEKAMYWLTMAYENNNPLAVEQYTVFNQLA